MKDTTIDRLYWVLFALISLFWLPLVAACALWVGGLFT